MSSDPRIVVENVSKSFRIPFGAPATLKHRILHPFERTEWRRFDALQDVSLEVGDGEFLGIVGRNGCGKSTLLKLLAGIYRPDSGVVSVRGSLAPLIELGVGFNQELSARDNVYINGTLLGMTARQLSRRFDEIVDFAELDGFMDLKLRNFSSGMVVRLAFAIAVLADSDILLADEVLAVGDERFQQKCFDAFRRRREAGQTVVFVTHDMDAMQQFCDRAMLLEQGRQIVTGDPRLVARAYRSVNAGLDASEAVERAGGAGSFELVECRINGSADLLEVEQGRQIVIEATWRAQVEVQDPILSFAVTDRFGRFALRWNTLWADVHPGSASVGDLVHARFGFENRLARGRYDVAVGAASELGARMLGIVDGAASIESVAELDTGGMWDPAVVVAADIVSATPAAR